MNTERPIANCLLICDEVITDEKTKKKSLIGIFNTIGGVAFPVRRHKVCIFAALTNGNGTVEIAIRCEHVNKENPIFETRGPIIFPDPNATIDMILVLRNFEFPDAGLYSFALLHEGVPLIEKRFNVQQLIDPRKRG